MQDFIQSFSQLGQGCKVFIILMAVFFTFITTYLVIQSIRHKEF